MDESQRVEGQKETLRGGIPDGGTPVAPQANQGNAQLAIADKPANPQDSTTPNQGPNWYQTNGDYATLGQQYYYYADPYVYEAIYDYDYYDGFAHLVIEELDSSEEHITGSTDEELSLIHI